jgi:AcrR family transcriptional regulator
VTAKATAWDRQRAALRAEIITAACALFVEQGFEATTVDQIAGVVGISRRSFFRYFGTKEDVLLSDLAGRGDAAARALARRPADEDPWQALRAAVADSVPEGARDASEDLAIGRIMRDTPSLRARRTEKRLHWNEALVPMLAARIGGHEAEFTAAAIVAAALSCLDVASDAWLRSDGKENLADLYDKAVAAVLGQAEPAEDPSRPQAPSGNEGRQDAG